jgi:hypothetical protein
MDNQKCDLVAGDAWNWPSGHISIVLINWFVKFYRKVMIWTLVQIMDLHNVCYGRCLIRACWPADSWPFEGYRRVAVGV